MLKKISVQQLKLGMHLKEFCGSWMEHPFWRSGFVITDPKDIQSILASSIKEVWIDVSKGLDVPAGEPSVSEDEAEAEMEQQLQQPEERPKTPTPTPAPTPTPTPTPAPAPARVTAPASMKEEIARASKICFESKKAVMSMFQEARMGRAVDTVGAERMVDEISDSVTRNSSAIISLARLKTADDYTYMHSVAVCAMMISLAKQMGLDDNQARSAGMAGLMHDLGKAMMPIDVLNKPGKLTDEEFGIIKSHPEKGYDILKQLPDIDPVTLEVCLHHHEKTDGSGYPHRLKADEISLYAKMGAVCDVYDAITSNRPYKAGWDPAESLRKMAGWAEGHFDQRVFQAFVKSLGIYPIGSLVRLESGRIAVVTEQSTTALTTPKVKVFFSTKSNMRIPPEIIDLAAPTCRDKIAVREDPAKWRFPDINELWSGLPDLGS